MVMPAISRTASRLILLLYVLFQPQLLYASSDKPDAPASIEGATTVKAEDIFELVEKLPELVIIDARIRTDRIQGYIQGSVSLPDIETSCSSLKQHINNKSVSALFYCNGVKCGRSEKAAKIALQCGYKNLYWFRGGFEEWKYKKLPFIKK